MRNVQIYHYVCNLSNSTFSRKWFESLTTAMQSAQWFEVNQIHSVQLYILCERWNTFHIIKSSHHKNNKIVRIMRFFKSFVRPLFSSFFFPHYYFAFPQIILNKFHGIQSQRTIKHYPSQSSQGLYFFSSNFVFTKADPLSDKSSWNFPHSLLERCQNA